MTSSLSEASPLSDLQNSWPRELYREHCQDEEGNPYVVIVWQERPGLGITTYTLEDGSPVTYEDGCDFQIVATGKFITRCEDPDAET
ncbi:hypothetical protein [Bosea lathyri]|uniref:Uncharacterized protein n=1 Tax=Bosea lathyri TaxID=1036778 RepID=A0A1H5XFH4_9HYPH|nr:hypothetical protein [Bosea lathyri]SEG10180.1 hypothetical protein SAMN04488115_103214 [Bosea lathyri]